MTLTIWSTVWIMGSPPLRYVVAQLFRFVRVVAGAVGALVGRVDPVLAEWVHDAGAFPVLYTRSVGLVSRVEPAHYEAGLVEEPEFLVSTWHFCRRRGRRVPGRAGRACG